MHRFLPHTVNHWLAALAALSLFAGWLTTYSTLGAAIALTPLCILAIRAPHSKLALPWSRPRQPSTPPAPEPPAPVVQSGPPPRPKKAKSGAKDSLVEQMVDQGRGRLLLRPQTAANLSD